MAKINFQRDRRAFYYLEYRRILERYLWNMSIWGQSHPKLCLNEALSEIDRVHNNSIKARLNTALMKQAFVAQVEDYHKKIILRTG